MLKKKYYKDGKLCRVWFYLPAELHANQVHLVGDFNDWNETQTPMKKKVKNLRKSALPVKRSRSSSKKCVSVLM